jgi:hypothetical protein
MRSLRRCSLAPALGPALAVFFILQALAGRPAAAQVTVVDMIPDKQSSEQSDDSEPNLAVDPAHPLRMAATAFTPDPTAAGQGVVFLSSDGGGTWTIKPVLPGSAPNTCPGFCDVTLRFAGTSGRLYVSDLTSDPQMNITLRVSRFDDIFGAAVPVTLETRQGAFGKAPDQPYIQATTVLGGEGTGDDRLFVGVNDARPQVAPQTATVDVDANAGPPSPAPFSSAHIEQRMPPDRDGSAVRTAIHPSGTVYAAFYGARTGGQAEMTVVRDDHWGTSPQPFTALKDAASIAGIVVEKVPYVPVGMLGSQKVGRSQLSIAVDPNDVRSVWLAWGDAAPGASITLHVRHSGDGGASWSSADLRTIPGATNPALAVNSRGKVGFLYQQFFSNGSFDLWTTALEISDDGFATVPQPIVLAKTLQEDSINTGPNPIGDYEHLMAVGKDFFGVFSADNTPDMSRFPSGVSYQREHNFAKQELYADAAHSFMVQASIDPYFFHYTDTTPDQDFFVRDWTDATGHDPGLEPSTHSVFYTTSDVWNRVTDDPGALSTTSAPAHQDPQDAMGGQNYAFVRIGRKAAAAPGSADVQVTAHFLYANFGFGWPYGAAGSVGESDSALNFSAAQTEEALAATQGFSWLLPTNHSTHICMAVEILGPNDPFDPPDLDGKVPGWPTIDTAVLYDNNKAQRNILYPKAKKGGKAHYYALARNAAPVQRDVYLRMDSPIDTLRRLGQVEVDACGTAVPYQTGSVLTIPAMAPGEVRPVRVSIALLPAAPGVGIPLAFTEVTAPGPAGLPRDGFAIAPVPSTIEDAARYDLVFQRAVLARAVAIDNDPTTADLAAQTRDLLLANPAISAAQYVAFLTQQAPHLSQVLAALPRPASRCGPSPTLDLEHLLSALGGGDPGTVTDAHSDFLQSLDTAMTLAQPLPPPAP